MDLETRVLEMESQVRDLQEAIRALQAERQAQNKRVRRAEQIALLHSEDCDCTACLIYKINREVR
jgi:hypothetical protein